MRARMMFERGIDRDYASYIQFSIVWNEIGRRHRPAPANGRTGMKAAAARQSQQPRFLQLLFLVGLTRKSLQFWLKMAWPVRGNARRRQPGCAVERT